MLNETICADGGVLKELYKRDDLGQITFRTIPPKTTVGGHKHLLKNEAWLVIGECEIRIQYPKDGKDKYRTHKKQPFYLLVPKGTGHEIENLDDEEAILVFYSDKVYDPTDKHEWS